MLHTAESFESAARSAAEELGSSTYVIDAAITQSMRLSGEHAIRRLRNFAVQTRRSGNQTMLKLERIMVPSKKEGGGGEGGGGNKIGKSIKQAAFLIRKETRKQN